VTAFPTEADLRAIAGDDPAANWLVDMFAEVQAEVDDGLREVTWRDDEVYAAMARWPARAHEVFHAGPLCWPHPEFPFPDLEWFWRGHFREILDRAGQGGDTRLATYPEICLLMSAASKMFPLRTDAFGLYTRAWCTAFPAVDVGMGALSGELAHYERMNGTGMDTLERHARDAVARRHPGRRIGKDEICGGWHYGEPAPDCPYPRDLAAASTPARRAKRATPASRARAKARTKTRAGTTVPAVDDTLAAQVAELFAKLPGPRPGKAESPDSRRNTRP
jgi:hypothetical protein